MFEGCTEFNQPLDNWNTSQVTDMYRMFEVCTQFNQPLDNWNTSQVKYMNGMFYRCRQFNQSLQLWDTSQVKYMRKMFDGCTNLYKKPFNDEQIIHIKDTIDMYKDCINIGKEENYSYVLK